MYSTDTVQTEVETSSGEQHLEGGQPMMNDRCETEKQKIEMKRIP